MRNCLSCSLSSRARTRDGTGRRPVTRGRARRAAPARGGPGRGKNRAGARTGRACAVRRSSQYSHLASRSRRVRLVKRYSTHAASVAVSVHTESAPLHATSRAGPHALHARGCSGVVPRPPGLTGPLAPLSYTLGRGSPRFALGSVCLAVALRTNPTSHTHTSSSAIWRSAHKKPRIHTHTALSHSGHNKYSTLHATATIITSYSTPRESG